MEGSNGFGDAFSIILKTVYLVRNDDPREMTRMGLGGDEIVFQPLDDEEEMGCGMERCVVGLAVGANIIHLAVDAREAIADDWVLAVVAAKMFMSKIAK